ncbi:MAG: hypothetical protein Q3Y08_03380 [Butyricicoccus sp.]|nr:hypothetical protein [Butyricicoccus sp.]
MELIFFLCNATRSEYAYEPFETILDEIWLGPCFLIALCALIVYIISRFLDDSTRDSRAIYTLMTLPGPFWAVPLAWATTLLAAVCMLAAIQLLWIFVLYGLYLPLPHLACQFYQENILNCDTVSLWDFPTLGFRKGLSYAFLRNSFLHSLLPLHGSGLPLWLARLLFPVAVGTTCLSIRRWRRMPFVAIVIAVLIYLHVRCSAAHMPWLAGIALLLEAGLLFVAIFSFRRARNLA